MAGFQTPIDIANSALAMLRQPAIYSFADPAVEAFQMGAQYDQLRLAELRRNTWVFATRRVWLRPISGTSMALAFPSWNSGTVYAAGDVVTYHNATWVALSPNTASAANTPGVTPSGNALIWDTYAGPTTCDIWNGPIQPPAESTAGRLYPSTYDVGEFAYTTPGDGSYKIYRSLVNNNGNNPATVDQWVDSTNYTAGQVVSFSGTNYQSLVNFNANNQPPSSQWTTTITSPLVSNSWETMTGSSLAPLNIIYPVNTGPINDTATRNVFVLPSGFLRMAHPDPKANQYSWLGGPQPYQAPDWVLEGSYLISALPHPINFRFIADTQNVVGFDPLFAEGLAMRLAVQLAPRLADADTIGVVINAATRAYAAAISQARTVNGIEIGAQTPPESPLITCRY